MDINIFENTLLQQEDIIAFCLAILCGFFIGLEREIRGRPSGLRTQTLISLGCCTYVVIASRLQGETLDPTRVLGQIVTGIGFLGAGVIMNKEQNVYGLTSAATIWMVSAIGCTIGLHYYATGIILTLLTLFILIVVDKLHILALKIRARNKKKSKQGSVNQ